VTTPRFSLRDVELTDVDAYVRMRCDPVMMAELGGPRPAEEIPAKVAADVAHVQAGAGWILMIIPEGTDDVAGSVVLWTNSDHGEPYSEIGWMVLPERQGQGLAKAAVREVLDRARRDGRWGPIHAYPGVTNGPSNGICRSLGFTLLGQEVIDFADTEFAANHWMIDPHA
jgi:RimJ/RimL family protein N-acetyltransferase